MFKTYLFHYQHDGASWGFEIDAISLEDAKTRLAKIAGARYDGVLVLSIPVAPAFNGLFTRLVKRFLPATRRDPRRQRPSPE